MTCSSLWIWFALIICYIFIEPEKKNIQSLDNVMKRSEPLLSQCDEMTMMMMMIMNAETVKKVQNDQQGWFNLRKWDYYELTRGRGVFIRVYLLFLSQLHTIGLPSWVKVAMSQMTRQLIHIGSDRKELVVHLQLRVSSDSPTKIYLILIFVLLLFFLFLIITRFQ